MATELEYIPGVTVDVQDGNLTIPRNVQGTSVLLLGVCVSGYASKSAAMTVYSVSSPDKSAREVANLYGTTSERYSELSKAILECHAAGCSNIKYMNIDASGLATLDGSNDAVMTDSNRYDMLNEAYANLLADDTIDIIVPVGAVVDASGLTADQDFGYQLANFCYLATKSRNQVIGVIGTLPAATGEPTYAELKTWAENLYNFTNCPNFDGTTPNDDDTDVDPTGTYKYYAMTTNTIERLLDYEDPYLPSNPSDANITLDNDGTKVDIGYYIQACAMDVWAFNRAGTKLAPTLGYYAANGAAAYAGLISTLSPQSAPTKKVLGGVAIRKPIALPTLDKLNKARFVCLENVTKGLTVSNAMTGAHNVGVYGRSDFVRLTTVRCTFAAIEEVRNQAEPFIGEPNSPDARAALEVAIREGLMALKRAGILLDFSFSITATPQDIVLGYARVNLVLQPAFELIKIPVTVALTYPSAEGGEE